MEEKLIIMIIYGFTFLLVLFLQIMSPKISRKNIFLGVKLPEEKIRSKEVAKIYKEYRRNNLIIGSISFILLLVLTYIYFDNLLVITILPFIYIAILFMLYLYSNKKVKELKKEEGWTELADNVRVVDVNYSREREKLVPIYRWLLIPFIILLANLAVGIYMYPSLPDRIPTHWNIKGIADKYSESSFFNLMLINIVQFIIIIIFYISYCSMAKSRHELDRDNPELSIERHRIFIKAWNTFLKYTLVGMQIIFTYINLATLGIIKNLRYMMLFTLIYLFITLIWTVYLSIKLGQGGDRIKVDSIEKISNRYAIEDDDMWKLGNTIYYNPDDPVLFVEKRVGVGWSINMGRPLGFIIMLIPLLILLITIYIAIKEG